MSYRQELYQGPGPPWCVGHLFSNPQLQTGANAAPLGPLMFDRVGEPEELISTGFRLQLFDDPFIHPVKQSDYLFEDPSIHCPPSDLVNEMLQEDLAAKLAMIHDSNHILGNRLECVNCSDEKLQLFFPVGPNVHSIGSILCRLDRSGHWRPVKKRSFEADSNWLKGAKMFISPSLSHPIFQISALKLHVSSADETLLLARTPYQVHVVSAQRGYDRTFFKSPFVASYRQIVSHVTWNPHYEGEIATVLENGKLYVHDVDSTAGNLRQNLAVGDGISGNSHSSAHNVGKTEFARSVYSHIQKHRSSWWRCEYAWHPRLLILANAEEITLLDLRSKLHANEPKTTELATILNLRNYCEQFHIRDRFGALERSLHEGMYHFVTATYEHILLFDVRRPKTPLLQWEHGMRDDFPGFLSTAPLSTLRGEGSVASATGKVILAASFRSGGVRSFCYGPQAPAAAIISGASSRFRDIEDAHCAWDFPSKIFTSQFPTDCWMDAYASALNVVNTRQIQFDLNFVESLSGLTLLPSQHGTQTRGKGFGLLQLTGSGEVFLQSYMPSKNLRSGAPRTMKESEAGNGVTGKKKTVMKYRTFSALLNYVKHRVACSEDFYPPRHKRRKTDLPAEKHRDLILKVLEDTDILLSSYEISFKVLLLGLPASLANLTSGLPSNVAGYVENYGRSPYLLPPKRFVAINESPVPLPLPFVLEIEQKTRSDAQTLQIRSENHFEEVYHLVEQVTSGLASEQQDPVVNLSQVESADEIMNNLPQRLYFHKRQDTEVPTSSKKSEARFENFIGSRQFVSESSESSGLPLRFKASDGRDGIQFEALAHLQRQFEEWQESFAPYSIYCKERKVLA